MTPAPSPRLHLAVAAAVLGGIVAAPLGAQRTPAERAALLAHYDSLRARAGTDSAARMRVMEYAWEQLAPYLLRASVDTATQPWIIRLPEDDPLAPRMAAHLATALRARPPVPADTAVWTLAITGFTIAGDTARATILLDYEHRCAPGARVGGWGNQHRVFARRSPAGPWGPARSTSVLHGDRAMCQPPR